MGVSYDLFANAFLSKITEYEFIGLEDEHRTSIVDGYMKGAVAAFKRICKYDLASSADDELREFSVEIPDEDLDEIVDIVSDGMVVQWMKPYVHRQELLENALSTKDFTTYSPAELLKQVNSAYEKAKNSFTQAMREYSFNVGDLTGLHL